MVSHKVANTFIRKYNNHFQIKGYSKLNIVDKKKLIESKLRSLSSDDVRKARSEWQTLKEGLTTKAHTKPTKASTPSSKTSSEKGAAGVGKIPAKPKSTSSRASTASTETTTPAPPSLRLSLRSSQKDRVSSLVSSKALSSQNFRPRGKKAPSTASSEGIHSVSDSESSGSSRASSTKSLSWYIDKPFHLFEKTNWTKRDERQLQQAKTKSEKERKGNQKKAIYIAMIKDVMKDVVFQDSSGEYHKPKLVGVPKASSVSSRSSGLPSEISESSSDSSATPRSVVRTATDSSSSSVDEIISESDGTATIQRSSPKITIKSTPSVRSYQKSSGHTIDSDSSLSKASSKSWETVSSSHSSTGIRSNYSSGNAPFSQGGSFII
tara:strand:+ start:227 stop:1363 length:1137 start_codon:yes stop_codon:yes gene_type:complete